jgi:hypothetical protein
MSTSAVEIERLKAEADLVAYACRRRGYYVDKAESSPRGNPTNWILRRDADEAKILVVRGPKCWLYYDLKLHKPPGHEVAGSQAAPHHAGPDGYGTIIDFVQEELRLGKGPGTPSFGIALKEIRTFVGRPLPPPSPRCRAARRPLAPGPALAPRGSSPPPAVRSGKAG